jgi:hypothetical protein
MRHPFPARMSPSAGIALGPILFILAILAIIGAVLSAGSGGFSGAGITDRVVADISTQANLIRAKINECIMMYGANTNYDTYPPSDMTNGTLVSALTCSGDPTGLQGLWSGNRPANLPPPTSGFNNWMYINTNATGGTGKGACIWILPSANSGPIIAGLIKAATKFTTHATNDGTSEVNFDPSSTNHRFVVWISTPPAAGNQTPNCDSDL